MTSHQWWGDLVTLRTWSEVWINESFATYCDYLYLDHALGPDEGAVNLLKKKNEYLREARGRYIRPIVFDRYEKPQDVFDAHSYPKGALVLHMLRSILGDDAFFRTLSAFLHENEFRAVDTHDFSKVVKDITGRNMDWFFEQWLYKPGHPVFDVASSWDEAAALVRLRVRQVQDTCKGIPVYKMPVQIGITTKDGTEVHQVWINDEDEVFEFRAASQPFLVRFDQDNVLLKELNFPRSCKDLMFQLGKDDVIGRMEAASQLVPFGKDKAVQESLKAAAGNDPFWAVRESATQALGRIGDPALTWFLKQKCADVHPRVRTAALSALGEFRQPGLAGFFKKQYRQERSYVAQAEALRALGKIGDRSAEAFLKDAEKTPSFRNIIQRAAREALKSAAEDER